MNIQSVGYQAMPKFGTTKKADDCCDPAQGCCDPAQDCCETSNKATDAPAAPKVKNPIKMLMNFIQTIVSKLKP